MSKATTFGRASDKPVDYKAAVVECIGKIDSLMEKMTEDEREIDRLKAETREILERLKAA